MRYDLAKFVRLRERAHQLREAANGAQLRKGDAVRDLQEARRSLARWSEDPEFNGLYNPLRQGGFATAPVVPRADLERQVADAERTAAAITEQADTAQRQSDDANRLGGRMKDFLEERGVEVPR